MPVAFSVIFSSPPLSTAPLAPAVSLWVSWVLVSSRHGLRRHREASHNPNLQLPAKLDAELTTPSPPRVSFLRPSTSPALPPLLQDYNFRAYVLQ